MGIPVQPGNIPPPQSSVSQFPNPAQAGQWERSPYVDRLSKTADTALAYGYGCCYGASQAEVKTPASSGDITTGFQGMVLMQEEWEPVGPPGGPYSAQYRVADPVPVLAKGRGWAVCSGTLTDNSAVYCYFETAGGNVVGTFTGASDAHNALVPNARCRIGAVGTPGSLALASIEFFQV